ncbi:MAG: Fur family transcriptional regulator [Woeseiaceae bacterium]
MSRQDIEEKLKRHGILPTTQRLEVAETLLARPQHLSADQIIDQLRSSGCRVSKATVYNTLKLFTNQGLIKEINVADSRKFFDSTTHPHHHFYHVETGELTDIPASSVGLLDLPPLPEGTEQDGVEVLIRVRDKPT